jgi:3-oxoacyl-[acyl-carrier protein] reductase
LDRTVNLNGRGTLLLMRAILPILAPTGSRVLNIRSSTSRDPDPDMTIYAGTKGMVENFTRCWARDIPRRYGCTVNMIALSPVGTESLLTAPVEFLSQLRNRSDRVPVASRFAKPEEIASAVAALCDERTGWLNG